MANRTEMMEGTRERLIAAARKQFATKGYANSAMDSLTSEAGVTRGALYHQFGDKKGLLEAVIAQIDAEMTARLEDVTDQVKSPWRALNDELVAYATMAAEPEIQRIVLLDGPAVLGDPSTWPTQIACMRNTKKNIERLMEQGLVRSLDAEALARLISAAALGAAQWVASSEDPKEAARKVAESLPVFLLGIVSITGGHD